MNKRKLNKLFLMNWRKLWILAVAGFASIILHNAIYAIFKIEEPVFFIIVLFVIPIYFITSLFYTLVYIIKHNKKKRRKLKTKK